MAMQVYRVPVVLRFGGPGVGGLRKWEWRTIDGFGLQVRYDSETPPSDLEVKRCLTGVSAEEYFVAADNLQKAIEKVHSWKAWNTGDGQEENRALRIDLERPIVELPFCEHMHLNSDGDFICGEPCKEDPPNGKHGMCILERYDPPSFCPVHPFFNVLPRISPLEGTPKESLKSPVVKEVQVDEVKYPFISSLKIIASVPYLEEFAAMMI